MEKMENPPGGIRIANFASIQTASSLNQRRLVSIIFFKALGANRKDEGMNCFTTITRPDPILVAVLSAAFILASGIPAMADDAPLDGLGPNCREHRMCERDKEAARAEILRCEAEKIICQNGESIADCREELADCAEDLEFIKELRRDCWRQLAVKPKRGTDTAGHRAGALQDRSLMSLVDESAMIDLGDDIVDGIVDVTSEAWCALQMIPCAGDRNALRKKADRCWSELQSLPCHEEFSSCERSLENCNARIAKEERRLRECRAQLLSTDSGR